VFWILHIKNLYWPQNHTSSITVISFLVLVPCYPRLLNLLGLPVSRTVIIHHKLLFSISYLCRWFNRYPVSFKICPLWHDFIRETINESTFTWKCYL
jgi:hypothetical protein